MKAKWMMPLVALMLTHASLLSGQPSNPYFVNTQSGWVKGFNQENTVAFLGIPYAKVERFMPPMPVDKWEANGAKERVLILRDEFVKAVEKNKTT